MAAKLHAADSGVVGRSAALGTIPLSFNTQRDTTVVQYEAGTRKLDAIVVNEAEAPTTCSLPQGRGTTDALTRADSTCSVGAQEPRSTIDRAAAPAPVVALRLLYRQCR